MPPDCDLLRQFADQGDEAAFAELVRRHADFVYSVALRVTCNGALAQDVTQAVFTAMARQAGKLLHYETLLGWLHTTTRHIAINTVRGEARRRVREHEATAMQNINSIPETNWTEIGPLLDEAVGQLREPDCDAVLLRFFKNLSHQEVGAALGLGEEAARKRMDRALDKLREHFARRGVTASSALLAAAITENSVQAAPVGLVASVTTAGLAEVGSAAAGGAILLALIMSTKTKITLAIVVLLAIAATLAIKMSSPGESPTLANSTPSASIQVAASQRTMSIHPPQVVAPSAKPVPASGTAPEPAAPATESIAQSRTDLKTYVSTLTHLLETDDFVGLTDCIIPPDEITNDLKVFKTREELAAHLRQELESHGGVATLLNALRSIDGRDPDLDPTGTQATYKLDVPFGGHDEIQFTKNDSLWYGPH